MNTIWQGYRNTLMYVVLGAGISMMITVDGRVHLLASGFHAQARYDGAGRFHDVFFRAA